MLLLFVFIVLIVKYTKLKREILEFLNFPNWNIVPYIDEEIVVKSRKALENYNDVKFFKENREKLEQAERIIKSKNEISNQIKQFILCNNYKKRFLYRLVLKQLKKVLSNSEAYRVRVRYISSSGKQLGEGIVSIKQEQINRFKEDPSLIMGKGEYNKFLKEKQKEELNQKRHQYYEKVNEMIDLASNNRDLLVIKGNRKKLDDLILKLYDNTVSNINKIKEVNSDEWVIIKRFMDQIENEIGSLIKENQKLLDYYESQEFSQIKQSCEKLMASQKDFNEYIGNKITSISKLFGTRVIRNETVNNDEYNYIRPYKKAITPFTAEVSSAIFASAENDPLEYIVKIFYPNKRSYPEQIQKLYKLIEELETLKDAKQILDNYKEDYQEYLIDVPKYVMEKDEAGFYSRLGFANIDEDTLTVEYKFSYTSNGGMAQRTFTVPMTEDTIIELIKRLENKLTSKAFAKEQRSLMTKKLREYIKQRDNHTCCICGNSTYEEPNLLLEIDHIIPVSKGGYTVEENLQTLCWKCNRTKSDKLLSE